MPLMTCATPLASPATEQMFGKIVVSALFAGFAAGLIAALLQFAFVQPVLLHAELYEGGELVHFGATPASAHPELPGFDPLRDGLSVLFTAVIYTAYALVLIAGMALAQMRGVVVTPRAGLIWGLAGFVAVHLAPAIGLPPEVPGVAAADVGARQIWWYMTVGATVTGLALIAFARAPGAWIAAAALLLAPHLIGAPEPSTFVGTVPPEIAALFAARALGVGLAAWAILGLMCAWFWDRETQADAVTARG